MKNTEIVTYQIVDSRNRYRSIMLVQDEPIEFINKDRKDAIVYTKKEAFGLAKYYSTKGVDVMVEIRKPRTKKDI